jgi:hypothetical protein
MDGPADIRCHEIVELVTDYLDDAMSEADRTRFEMHVMVCRGCENYLDQMRRASQAVGEVAVEEPDEKQMTELLEAFRGWHRKTIDEG